MQTSDLDFDLPPELIAQTPLADRGASRLLHYQRQTRRIDHHTFSQLPALLRRGDLLVFNNARVLAARFLLQKETGGLVEGLFLREISPGDWNVLLKAPGPTHRGQVMRFAADPDVRLRIEENLGEGEYRVGIDPVIGADALLDRIGRMPLPPYIRRNKRQDQRDAADRQRYQTVYAAAPGSVAAPTAGLHFTPEILAALAAAGVESTFVTLHVGIGTFRPVSTELLDAHSMHSEAYEIDSGAAGALTAAKQQGRRIIAVGTTSARVLESQPAGSTFAPVNAQTRIFIRPAYAWKHVGALLTNFHLPRSTLIALVAALVGLEEQRRIYRSAIAERYRFFSFGDCMFIE